MWRRVAALVIVLALPASGLWIARSCDQTALDETNMPETCANGMCPMHHDAGEYCPRQNQHQQDKPSTCQMSSCTHTQIVATATGPAVMKETASLVVTIESRRFVLPATHTLHSTILEFPTPPPRGM